MGFPDAFLISISPPPVASFVPLQLTRKRAMEFYGEHEGKAFFEGLVDFMTSGPVMALCLSKDNAILGWRALMGPTDSNKARAESPKSLRALFGTDGRRNATHGSDSTTSAAREIKFFFPKIELDTLPDAEQATRYLQKALGETLLNGLVEMSKKRPVSNSHDGIKWMIEWLQENNPRRPKIRMVEEMPLDMLSDDEEEFEAVMAAQEEMAKSAIKIQSTMRGKLARKQITAKKLELEQDRMALEELERAAVKIQASARGRQARSQVDALKAELKKKEAEILKEEDAAIEVEKLEQATADAQREQIEIGIAKGDIVLDEEGEEGDSGSGSEDLSG